VAPNSAPEQGGSVGGFPLVLVFVRDTLLDGVVFIDSSGRIVGHPEVN
jgi:hypothetical protein